MMKNLVKTTVVAIVVLLGSVAVSHAQSPNVTAWSGGATNQAGTTGTSNVVAIFKAVTIPDGGKFGMAGYSVPAGQRLVIENFSAKCAFSQPAQATAYINAAAVFAAFLPMPAMYWPADGANSYRAAATSPVRAYADGPGCSCPIRSNAAKAFG